MSMGKRYCTEPAFSTNHIIREVGFVTPERSGGSCTRPVVEYQEACAKDAVEDLEKVGSGGEAGAVAA